MTREEKIEKKQKRAKLRYQKNLDRNVPKLQRKKEWGTGMDCPFDAEINSIFGSCNCGGINYESCLGDI
jgi:hypothetical protein